MGLLELLDCLCYCEGVREEHQVCGHGLLSSDLVHEFIAFACAQVDASSSQLEGVNGLFGHQFRDHRADDHSSHQGQDHRIVAGQFKKNDHSRYGSTSSSCKDGSHADQSVIARMS